MGLGLFEVCKVLMMTTMIDRNQQSAESIASAAGSKIAKLAKRAVHRCGGEEGSTLVEMAFVLPILLVVLTGIFSFGITLNQYLVLTNAVNNGARAFAMSAGAQNGSYSIMDSGDPCRYAAGIIQSAASNLSASNLSYTITYTTYSTGAVTTYTGTGSTAPSCASLPMNQYDIVQIQAVYPVTPTMFGWVSRSLSLTAQSAELVQ
jgi:Flp pilus assembly protein TadG